LKTRLRSELEFGVGVGAREREPASGEIVGALMMLAVAWWVRDWRGYIRR
jgi:hypothetical protein